MRRWRNRRDRLAVKAMKYEAELGRMVERLGPVASAGMVVHMVVPGMVAVVVQGRRKGRSNRQFLPKV